VLADHTASEAIVGAIWQFVVGNKDTLAWLGGGVVVVAGGLWAVAKFFLDRDKGGSVSAVGGVAARGNVSRNTITITSPARPEDDRRL